MNVPFGSGESRGTWSIVAGMLAGPWGRFALLGFVLLAWTGCKKETDYVPQPPPQVGVARPLSQDVRPHLELTGTTAAVNEVDLVARVAGFLQEIDYKDGALVGRGATLFVIEPAPYEAKVQQAQATLTATQAQLIQAEAEFTRQSTLGRSDFASQSTVDQARAKRDAMRANLVGGQAELAIAGINLGYTRVLAPFDGLVSAHLVSAGEMVGAAGLTKLATIVQLDPIYVTFNVNEQDVLRIKAAVHRIGAAAVDRAAIPVEAGLMNEDGYPHQGTLDYIAPAIDPTTGTLQVRGVLNNADHALLPGMFARVRVPLPGRGPALLVPDRVLGSDQGGRYVLVVDSDGVVQQRTVQTGQAEGDLRVILSGIGAEDRIVVSGLARAVPGEKVTTQDVAISPPTGHQ